MKFNAAKIKAGIIFSMKKKGKISDIDFYENLVNLRTIAPDFLRSKHIWEGFV
jgi:hypothetical protein